jgi:choline dehydrogenase
LSGTYDYIVVGAGSAGCIVASRLTEDPAVRVLLVEAGGSDRNPIIAMPAALPFVYQNRRIQWGYQSGPEPELSGRSIDEKSGKVLGGTSSINAMIFNRGNPLDYEGWAAEGLPEWDYAHCLPYFKRMETFSGGPDEWRGGNGPMQIGRCLAEHKLYDAFLRSGEEAGLPLTPDHNGYQQEGLHIAQTSIHNGVRWSTSRAYLRPAAKRPNLHVMSKTHVTKVLIENGAATGIEYADGSEPGRINCEREVIVCAGAYNSPKLLMLSGIGPADELRKHGIRIVAEVNEVGRDLQNHPGVDVQWATDHENSLTSELGPLGQVSLAASWALRRRGLGASNFFEAGAFLRTNDDVTFPNMQYEFLALTRKLQNGKLVPIPGFQFWMDLSRPRSRGRVTLRSADPADPPLIVFNHLAEREDLKDLADGVRLIRRIVGQPAWEPYRREELTPGPAATTDADLESFVRGKLGTSYHGSSSLRMGSDSEAVVDPEGRVRAVSRLRVVDASIMPKVVTANLNAPVMMMAEKLSDQILGKPPLEPSNAAYYQSGTAIPKQADV